MYKASEHVATGIACAILIALLGACGDDSGSSNSPEGSAGTIGSSAGTSAPAAGNSGTAAAGRSGAAGSTVAGRGAPTAGRGTGVAGRAGGSGTGAAGATSDDDAGVSPGAGGKAGAGGSAGAAAGASGAAAGTGGSGGAAAGSGGTGGTATGATFTEVYALFMTGCAGAMCHVGATRTGDNFSMADKATAYMNLVGVNSGSCQGEKRVVAGDPAKSELVSALAHTRIGSCTRTPQMPEGKPMFTAAQLDTVKSWVMAGAKND